MSTLNRENYQVPVNILTAAVRPADRRERSAAVAVRFGVMF
jgi:hypothetical protein